MLPPEPAPGWARALSPRVGKLLDEIDYLTVAEMAELRGALSDRWGTGPRKPVEKKDDDDEGETEGGLGVREPRRPIPPAGTVGAAVDPRGEGEGT